MKKPMNQYNKKKKYRFILFSLGIIIVILFNLDLHHNTQTIPNDFNNEIILKTSAEPIQSEFLSNYINGTGSSHEVFISGEIAYVADSNGGLEIVNISNPSNPQRIGIYTLGGSSARDVFVTGDLAYVAYSTMGLRIINISDPTNPSPVGSYDDSDGSGNYKVYIEGNLAYIADREDGLEIIDISDPSSPVEIGQYGDSYNNTYDVCVSGSIAFIADGYDGVEILDISNPSSPIKIGQYFDNNNNTKSIYLSGTKLYTVDSFDGFEVIDVGNLTNPTRIGRYTGGYAQDVYIHGNTGYFLFSSGRFEIIDVSNSSDLTKLGDYSFAGNSESIYYSSNIIYISILSNGVDIVNVSSIEGRWNVPEQLGSYDDLDGQAMDLFIWDNLAYIADWDGGLEIINITDPTDPDEINQVYNGSGRAMDVFVSNNIAYIADGGDGLEIVNVTDPSNNTGSLKKIGNYNDGDGVEVRGVYVSNNLAYITDAVYLEIINITDPTNPIEIGQCQASGSYGLEIQGNFAYIACWTSGLRIIDVSDPTTPKEIGQFVDPMTPGQVGQVKISGDYAFLPNLITGLDIIDVSNPYDPIRIVEQYEDGLGETIGAFAFGNRLFIGDGVEGVVNMDISDLSNVTSDYSTGFVSGHLYVNNNYIFHVQWAGGFHIFDNGYVNPYRVNSDTDGLSDGQELFEYGTDPDNWDSDDDELSDYDEINIHSTDPNDPDHDDDLMPDGWEVANELNPTLDDANNDYDGDDLTNLYEYNNGLLANDIDSEDDGMDDGWEILHSLNPLVNDSGQDLEPDGLNNLGEYIYGTNPHTIDFDGDGFSDGAEVNAGTDPTNPNDYPRASDPFPWLLQVVLAGMIGAFVVTASIVARKYIRQRNWEKTLHNLFVLTKEGAAIYDYSFGIEIKNPDMISGMISALTSFIKEATGSKKSLRTVDQQDKKLILSQGDSITVALLCDKDLPIIHKRISMFTQSFEDNYGKYLKNWRGEMAILKGADAIVTKHFPVSVEEQIIRGVSEKLFEFRERLNIIDDPRQIITMMQEINEFSSRYQEIINKFAIKEFNELIRLCEEKIHN